MHRILEAFAETPDATIGSLLETAAQLHEAALNPARWPEVMRAARLRLSLDRATERLTPEQASWLNSIVDNAASVCAEVARLEHARALARSAADAMPIGLALLDGQGRLLRANREAERLLRSLARAESGLAPTEPVVPAFDGLPGVAELARSTTEKAGTLLMVAGLARAGNRPIEALAVPVSSTPDPLTVEDSRAIVFLLDADQAEDVDEAALATAFELTPAEARLAGRLVRGDTVQEGARALGIKTTTARTHLARLLAKTGTSRQPELVRLLVIMSLRTVASVKVASSRPPS